MHSFYERSAFVKKMTYKKYTSSQFSFGGETQADTEEFRWSVRVYTERMLGYTRKESEYTKKVRKNPQLTMPLKFYIRLLALAPPYVKKQAIREINHESGWIECLDLGHLAVLISETKARCNMTSLLLCILEA